MHFLHLKHRCQIADRSDLFGMPLPAATTSINPDDIALTQTNKIQSACLAVAVIILCNSREWNTLTKSVMLSVNWICELRNAFNVWSYFAAGNQTRMDHLDGGDAVHPGSLFANSLHSAAVQAAGEPVSARSNPWRARCYLGLGRRWVSLARSHQHVGHSFRRTHYRPTQAGLQGKARSIKHQVPKFAEFLLLGLFLLEGNSGI